MRILVVPTLFSLVLVCGSATACCTPPGVEAQLFTRRGEGGTITYAISNERAKALPTWSPGSGEPPLSITAAIESARASVLASSSDLKSLEPDRISLNFRDAYGGNPGFWYYDVAFSPTVAGRRALVPGIGAVVLLDGSVVEPRDGE